MAQVLPLVLLALGQQCVDFGKLELDLFLGVGSQREDPLVRVAANGSVRNPDLLVRPHSAFIYMPGTERAMKKEDCLSCRVVGTAACLGSSAYIAFHTQGKRGLHKTIGVVASAGLVVMGVVRAFVS